MQNIIKFPQEIYNASLKEIDGVAFSAREVEIIAAILLGKSTQQISDIVSIVDEVGQDSILFGYKISESTVAAHIDNIYDKLVSLESVQRLYRPLQSFLIINLTEAHLRKARAF